MKKIMISAFIGLIALINLNALAFSQSVIANLRLEILTVSAGSGGTISPTGRIIVHYGSEETFILTPDTGYNASLTVDGTPVSLTNNMYTLTDIIANHTITASFTLQTETLSVSAGSSGTISPIGQVIVNYGSDQTFTLTPNTGYSASLTVDGTPVVLNNNMYTLTDITANHTIAASFMYVAPPVVNITAPTNGAQVSGQVAVTASASSGIGIAGVQFQLDGANLGTEVTTAPYSITWNTTKSTNTSHTLTAIAYDTFNNQATSPPVTVTVYNNSAPVFIKSTSAVMPLTGETLQLYSNNIHYQGNTQNQTLINFDLIGTDEGYPVQVGNQIILLFGDTLGAYQDQTGKFIFYTGNPGGDSIGYMPYQDMSGCNNIPGLLAQMDQGIQNPIPDFSGCPLLSFYTNPNHTSTQPAFQYINISGLTGLEGTGNSLTPIGTFTQDGYLYMFYEDIVQVTDQGNFHLETILTKSTQPVSSFSASNPPLFQKLYVASSHPTIPDPSNPPNQDTGPGKFIRPEPIIFSKSALAANGWLSSLPSALQNAQQVMFLFGTSWNNKSNVYLAAIDVSQIESGNSSWWYLVDINNGPTGWVNGSNNPSDETNAESQALPVISNSPSKWNMSNKPSAGEHGIVWSVEMQKFILMYTAAGSVIARSSPTPWGPWSNEVPVLGIQDTLAKEFIYPAGHMYGPFFIGPYNLNADGSVTYYFTLSPFAPYEVFMMKATFCGSRSCK